MNNKNFVKHFIGSFIRSSGLLALFNALIRDKATIVLYHKPKPNTLEKHLQFLSTHFKFITLDALVHAIYSKDWSSMPRNPLVVTLDDGSRDNFCLLNLFERYKVKPTLYVCSHIVNTHRAFWFDDGVPDPKPYFKYVNSERLKKLLERCEFTPTKEYPCRKALDLPEMTSMSPSVDFQSHSKFHPVLPKCSDEEAFSEIKESKERLTDLLGKAISHFSYPNGDYSEREIDQLKRAGYESARTCDLGWNDINTDPFRLKAMGIDDDASVNELVSQLYGISGFIRFARSGSFTGKHPNFT